MNRFWLLFFWWHLGLVQAGELQWIEPTEQKAVIVISSEKSQPPSPAQLEQWRGICQMLGKFLSDGSGEPTFISKFRCELGRKLDTSAHDKEWIIFINETDKFLAVDLYYQNDKKKIKVHSFSFRVQGNQLEIFSKDRVLKNLSRLIVESLPTGWVLNYDAKNNGISFGLSSDLPELPARLMVYRLAYDPEKNLWIHQPRAELRHVQEPAGISGNKKQNYKFGRIWLPLQSGQSYWVQNVAGLNQRQELYEKRLAIDLQGFSILNLVDRLIFDSLSSNYAGLRYGQYFLKGDSVIVQTALLSLLVEMRGGPLAGMRWYYDITPMVKINSDDGDQRFTMRRLSLGWAMEFDMPKPLQGLVSRFDVQPKLGLLDIDSQFLVENSTGSLQPLTMKAGNVLSLSLEVGIEKQTSFTRNRLWASFSSAKFGVKNRDGVAVYSNKAGFDAYFDLYSGDQIKWGALIFGLGENLQLGRDPDKISGDSDLELANIAFNLFYLGGGLTVSW